MRAALARYADKGNAALVLVEPTRRPLIVHAGKSHEVKDSAKARYEIGSITKVFTGLLMLQTQELGLSRRNQCAAEILFEHRSPGRVCLRELAAHLSGLPEWPGNFPTGAQGQPFLGYGLKSLLAALAEDTSAPLQRGAYRYSSYGTAVLGAALSRSLGTSYALACKRLVTAPLGLDAGFAPFGAGRSGPRGATAFGCFAPAGGMRMSAQGAASFLQACLAPRRTPLAGALRAAERVRASTGITDQYVATGWHVRIHRRQAVYWHNGRTPRGRSFLGYSLQSRRGVAIFSTFDEDWDDTGFSLLEK